MWFYECNKQLLFILTHRLLSLLVVPESVQGRDCCCLERQEKRILLSSFLDEAARPVHLIGTSHLRYHDVV